MDFILRADVEELISTHGPRELKAPPTLGNAFRLLEAVDASRRAKVQMSIEGYKYGASGGRLNGSRCLMEASDFGDRNWGLSNLSSDVAVLILCTIKGSPESGKGSGMFDAVLCPMLHVSHGPSTFMAIIITGRV